MAKRLEAEPAAGASSEPAKEALAKDLPVAEAPKLDGSEAAAAPAVTVSEAANEPAGESGAPALSPRPFRFALLAATLALAAALGSLSASGLAHLSSRGGTNTKAADTNVRQALRTIQSRLDDLAVIKTEIAQLSTLKANLEAETRGANGQFAKLADRLDRIERAQVEPASKIGRIAETVDRLEKREAAAAETTGSIGSKEPAATPETKQDKILQDWIVQDVRRGHALVASRYGGVFAVAPGSVLPGLGRVETIKRQDGQWVVITEHGLIAER